MTREKQQLPASFRATSANAKLSPVDFIQTSTWPRQVPRAPFCCSTYLSITSTCSSDCPFLDGGCYARASHINGLIKKLDSVNASPEAAIAWEVALVDAAFPRGVPQDGGRHGKTGRDLRLHVAGDVGASTGNALALAGMAQRWARRGGGAVWGYTHDWRHLSPRLFGRIAMLASVETPEDANRARALGYAVAIVLPKFPSKRAFSIPGVLDKVIPCPAEGPSSRVTCVTCRLCFDTEKLRARGVAIGFALHGRDSSAAHRKLPVILPGEQTRLPWGGA